MGELAIHTKALTRDFKALRAVDNLSLDVPQGKIFGLLGPNGAGKTTTIHLLLGLIKPTSGQSRVLGFDPVAQGHDVRHRTGALLEHHGLYERLSAERNLDYFGRIYKVPLGERRERARQLLEFTGLWDRRRELVGKFSKGMKQKLAIARTLLHRPPVVFLDEPTAGHDPASAKDVRDYIQSVVKEHQTTFFLTTHNLSEAEQLCDRIAIIQKGRLVAQGTPLDLRRSRKATTLIIEGGGWSRTLLASLQKQGGVKSVRSTESRLEIQVDAEARAAPYVTLLAKGGAKIEQVHRESMSLEAAYISLTEEPHA